MQIEDFIKHGPHCVAGKYSTMGRCSCGAQSALEELAALRSAAQQTNAADGLCPTCGRKLTAHDMYCPNNPSPARR